MWRLSVNFFRAAGRPTGSERALRVEGSPKQRKKIARCPSEDWGAAVRLCYGSQKGSVAQGGTIRHPVQFAMKRRSRSLKRKV